MSMYYYTKPKPSAASLVCSDCGAVMVFYRIPAPASYGI